MDIPIRGNIDRGVGCPKEGESKRQGERFDLVITNDEGEKKAVILPMDEFIS
jgi:hypothetical protein